MEEINEFDDFIKGSLDGLGDDLPTGDWSLFEEKMAADLNAEASDAAFDDSIRDQMNDLDVNLNFNHWEALSSKIDQEITAPEISDEALDIFVHDNIHQLEVPYNPAHWTLMSHRLEEEFSVRRKIAKYKIAEVVLMLLIIFTLFIHLPIVKKTAPDYSESSSAQKVAVPTTSNLTTNSIGSAISNNTTEAPTVSNLQTNNVLATSTDLISGLRETSNDLATSVVSEQTSVSGIAGVSKKVSASVMPTELLVKSPVSIIANSANIDLAILNLEINPAFDIAPIDPIATLDPQPIASVDFWDHTKITTTLNHKTRVRLGAVISADFNHVITPQSSPYKNNGYDQLRPGYGGGILIDFQHNRYTFSTGIVYHRVTYEPEQTIYLGGNFASGYQSQVYDAANLNMLTIPMNFHFRIDNKKSKWQVYALTGSSLNVMALNHYNVTTNNLGAPTPQRITAAQTPQRPNTNPVIIDQPTYSGLFEGGNFQRNHYFTANIGLGLERYISPRWSMFVQPIYQRELFRKGMGPNKDRIHTISIQFGVKSNFR